MMQKRIYVGQFNQAGELVKVISLYALPNRNKRIIPPNSRRITRAEYDKVRRSEGWVMSHK